MKKTYAPPTLIGVGDVEKSTLGIGGNTDSPAGTLAPVGSVGFLL